MVCDVCLRLIPPLLTVFAEDWLSFNLYKCPVCGVTYINSKEVYNEINFMSEGKYKVFSNKYGDHFAYPKMFMGTPEIRRIPISKPIRIEEYGDDPIVPTLDIMERRNHHRLP